MADTPTVTPRVFSVLSESGPCVAVGGASDEGQDLFIEGRLDGGFVVVGRTVTVGRAGRVHADIHGASIVVEGEVAGDLHGGDQILVRSGGTVSGRLIAPKVTLEQGSNFDGDIEMREPANVRLIPAAAKV